MKKLWDIFVLTLALNFLVLAALVGWLWQSGHVDHDRVLAVKSVLFPPPQPAAPTTQPSDAESPSAGPKRLEELLSKMAGKRSAAEQVEFIQQRFDTTAAELDRRQRVVEDLERQVAEENRRLAEDRKALEADRQQLAAREQEADRLANDKGFQDTLNLYSTMPAKQVKQVFMGLDDTTVAQYLDAMQPRTAAKILKEFKTPDETDRVKRVLEKMRRPPQPALAANAPTTQDSKDQ